MAEKEGAQLSATTRRKLAVRAVDQLREAQAVLQDAGGELQGLYRWGVALKEKLAAADVDRAAMRDRAEAAEAEREVRGAREGPGRVPGAGRAAVHDNTLCSASARPASGGRARYFHCKNMLIIIASSAVSGVPASRGGGGGRGAGSGGGACGAARFQPGRRPAPRPDAAGVAAAGDGGDAGKGESLGQ